MKAKKYLSIAIVAVMLAPVLPAQAATVDELFEEVTRLLQIIANLRSQLDGGASETNRTRISSLAGGLGFGSRGADVSELQRLLNIETGANLPVTGYFGDMTKAAVQTFNNYYKNYPQNTAGNITTLPPLGGSPTPTGTSLGTAPVSANPFAGGTTGGLGGSASGGSTGALGGTQTGSEPVTGLVDSDQWMLGKSNGTATGGACVRNKNWGNVKKGGSSDWEGTTGYDSSGHAIFDREGSGVRAYMLNLKNQYRDGKFKTIRQLISYYTSVPADRSAYISYIQKRTGFNPDTDIKLIKDGAVDKRVIYPMARAMFEFECGGDPGVNDVFLQEGYTRAFGADGKKI